MEDSNIYTIGDFAGVVWFMDKFDVTSHSNVPPNWCLSDGRSLLKLEHPDLYKILARDRPIKTTTHYFCLPDTRRGATYVDKEICKHSWMARFLIKLGLRKKTKYLVMDPYDDLPQYMIKIKNG